MTLILGSFRDDTGLAAAAHMRSVPDFKTYSERNAVPRHVSLNSLVRNEVFLTVLNKGLPGHRGKEETLTIKEPAATMSLGG